MNRMQLEHIIRAASKISGDAEIVIIGSQAIHALGTNLPPLAFHSMEADVFPRNRPECADEIDALIGELSPFQETHGYYAQGVAPNTAPNIFHEFDEIYIVIFQCPDSPATAPGALI
jgi:hypothetical protein